MADGGDTPMTAAEAVLAWLLIEKIGVPDDVGYSPNQAQEIIVRRLDLARELEEIDVMLAEGQGDDEGHPIMPEFAKGITTYAKRSEEHTSELQSLMRISYAVFCLKKK